MANNKVFEEDAVVGRISLRKDSVEQWGSYQTQVLKNGEVGFVESTAAMVPRMMVGDNSSSVFQILGTDSLEYLSKITEPIGRIKDNGAVFYSGVGAGYRLPLASATQLGGVRVDNNITTMDGEILTVKGLVKKYEEGKGYVLHFTDYNVEIDNTLYTHIDKNTQHYERLGLFVNLDKDITQSIKDLQGKKFYFYDILKERDMLENNTIPFGFTYSFLDEETEEVKTVSCKNFTVAAQQIKFDDLVVFDEGKWLSDAFRTIAFLSDEIYHDTQTSLENISFILRFGYPESYDDNGTPEPLNTTSRKYSGMIVNNYKVNGIQKYNALIGIDSDGLPRYSSNFNESSNNATANYLLYTSEKNVSDYTNNKNKIVGYNSSGDIIAKEIKEGTKIEVTNNSNGTAVTISHASISTSKTSNESGTNYINGLTIDNGHITSYTYGTLDGLQSNLGIDELTGKITSLESNTNSLANQLTSLQAAYTELLNDYNNLAQRVSALEQQNNKEEDE